MFGEVAVRLIKMMGHGGTVPGALLAEDIQPALERLQAAITAGEELPISAETIQEEGDEVAISLQHRALPLIELLQDAAKAKTHVMWDRNK